MATSSTVSACQLYVHGAMSLRSEGVVSENEAPECSLSARIVPGDGKCRSYRSSFSASCRDCQEWKPRPESPVEVAEVIVKPKVREVVTVAKKICSVEGCESPKHSRGMCWKHIRSKLCIDPGTGKPLTERQLAIKPIKETAQPAEAPVVDIQPCPECGVFPCTCFDDAVAAADVVDESGWKQQTFGKVLNAEGDLAEFGTDPVVVLALREAWQAKEAEWLADLSGLKPGQTIMRAVQMVAAVEGLGY